MAYSSVSPSSSSSSPRPSSSRSLSLSPAHSIKSSSKPHFHHQQSRRPSPLKRQMSLGVGNAASSSAVLNINPNRDHAAGPLAVLYSVKPDEDPLLAHGGGSPSKTSSSATNSVSRGSALHPTPLNDSAAAGGLSATVEFAQGTPRSVSALANRERTGGAAPLPSSPNRSLLAAFQAVSPRTQLATARSTSLPSLAHALASPRGVLHPQHSTLGPPSPINTSPRQSTSKNTYASAAFRALNGASPQKQVSSGRNTSSGHRRISASLPTTAPASPTGSGSSSVSRQAQSDAPSKLRSDTLLCPNKEIMSSNHPSPAWTIYRDVDGPAQIASTSSSGGIMHSEAMQEDSTDEGVSTSENDSDAENDENSNSALQVSNAALTTASMNTALSGSASAHRRLATPPATHRRGSLSTSSIPSLAARARDITPPPSVDRWREATQGTYPRESDASPAPISASAQRARKRLRTSGDLSL